MTVDLEYWYILDSNENTFPIKKFVVNVVTLFLFVQVDEFVVEAVTLKKLKKIRIGHDGQNPGAGWFLDKVVVRQADNPDYDTTFECNRCVTSLPADFYC